MFLAGSRNRIADIVLPIDKKTPAGRAHAAAKFGMMIRMPDYQLYCLDDHERIQKSFTIAAARDRDALDMARVLCMDYAIEVWEGDRLVARLPRSGHSSRPSHAPPYV